MTRDQVPALIARSRLIQDILPNVHKSVREIFLSGITPAEWDKTIAAKGRREHWRFYAIHRGYKFDHTDVSAEHMDQVDAENGYVYADPGPEKE